jgi:uncharacterized protein (TIGR02246 family)
MKLVKKMVLFVAGLIVFTAVAPMAVAADDAAAIQAVTAAWVKGYNAGNTDAIVALYAEDAVVMPPGAPPLRGHAAIRQYLVKDIAGSQAAGITLVLGSVNDVGVSGNLAWHSGTYSVTNKSGATIDTGKYLEARRKVGGKWQIIRDIWNSDTPSAAPVPPAAVK